MNKGLINKIAYLEFGVLMFLVAAPFLFMPSGEAAFGAGLAFILFLKIGAWSCFVISLIVITVTKGKTRIHVFALVLSLVLGLIPWIASANLGGSSNTEPQYVAEHQTPAAQKAIAWVIESGGGVGRGGKQIQLSRTKVGDILPLSKLPALEQLDLIDTNVRDLTPLANLTRLESLDLSGTEVSDITPLTDLTGLKTLYLNYTAVSDLSPIAKMTNLTTLRMIHTKVTDLSVLADLPNLRILRLDKSKVNREEAAKLRKALPNCSIRYSAESERPKPE